MRPTACGGDGAAAVSRRAPPACRRGRREPHSLWTRVASRKPVAHVGGGPPSGPVAVGPRRHVRRGLLRVHPRQGDAGTVRPRRRQPSSSGRGRAPGQRPGRSPKVVTRRTETGFQGWVARHALPGSLDAQDAIGTLRITRVASGRSPSQKVGGCALHGIAAPRRSPAAMRSAGTHGTLGGPLPARRP